MQVLAVVVMPTVLALAAASLLGRRRAVAAGDFDADSVSFVGGVLAALFTVVLAFYVVFAWQVGSDIQSSSDTEANALIDAYAQAGAAADPARSSAQGLLRDYASEVAEREWDSLRLHGQADPKLTEVIDQLRALFTALPATDASGQFAREQGLRDVRQIDESHRARVDSATGNQLFNRVLLGGTVMGAALMVAFPLLAGLSRQPVNVAVIGILAASLGAIVFLSLQLARPLDGPFGVDPDCFREALSRMSPLPDHRRTRRLVAGRSG
jgi:hypothetical protein